MSRLLPPARTASCFALRSVNLRAVPADIILGVVGDLVHLGKVGVLSPAVLSTWYSEDRLSSEADFGVRTSHRFDASNEI